MRWLQTRVWSALYTDLGLDNSPSSPEISICRFPRNHVGGRKKHNAPNSSFRARKVDMSIDESLRRGVKRCVSFRKHGDAAWINKSARNLHVPQKQFLYSEGVGRMDNFFIIIVDRTYDNCQFPHDVVNVAEMFYSFLFCKPLRSSRFFFFSSRWFVVNFNKASP